MSCCSRVFILFVIFRFLKEKEICFEKILYQCDSRVAGVLFAFHFRSGQTATNAHEGESISLEPDSLEPAPLSAASSRLSNPQNMGNAKSKSSPTLEDIEEVSVNNVTVVVSSASILDQLGEDVPWADDESWQVQSEPETGQDETDKAVPVDDSTIETPYVDEDGVHYLQDGHYWLEMPGLPPAEEPSVPLIVANGETEPRPRNIRVRFTTDPIRGAYYL